MAYDLMELSTGNLMGSYPDEDSALRDVRASVEAYGPDAVATLALALAGDGSIRVLAEGEALLHRAGAAPISA